MEPNALYSGEDHAFRENDPYARAKYELTLRWLQAEMAAGETLYNVGVGSGYFNHLAVSRGARVVGCEPDEATFRAALDTAPANCELHHCGIEEFARGRSPAKLVVMHDVLEHIADDAGAAEVLHGLVERGGAAVLSVPALMSLFGRHDEELGHYRRYTPTALRRVLEPWFTVERLRWYGMASIPIAWYFSVFKKRGYPLRLGYSPLGAIYGKVCALESYVPEPIGTSLIARLAPRA